MTIEELEKPEPERRLGIDMPLQSAPIGQRVLASLIDGILVVAAGAVFGAIYYRMVGVTPTPMQVAMLGSGLLILCWAAYRIPAGGVLGGDTRLACVAVAGAALRWKSPEQETASGPCALLPAICRLPGPWLCLALPRRRRLVLARAGDENAHCHRIPKRNEQKGLASRSRGTAAWTSLWDSPALCYLLKVSSALLSGQASACQAS